MPTTFESTNYTTAAKVLDASKPIVYSKVFSPSFLGVSADVAKDKNLSTLGADTEPYLMCEQKGITDGTKSTSLIESFLITIQNDHNGDLGDLSGNRITATFSFVAAGDLSADPKIHTSTFIINGDKANYKDAYAALVSKFHNGTMIVTKELLADDFPSSIYRHIYVWNSSQCCEADYCKGCGCNRTIQQIIFKWN